MQSHVVETSKQEQTSSMDQQKTLLENIDAVDLSKVIHIAMQKFIQGCDNNGQIKEKLKNQNNSVDHDNQWDNQGYVTVRDPAFVRKVAKVTDHFFATTGPRAKEMADFIQDLASNQIHHVVALGDHTAYKDKHKQDFHDYCLKERRVLWKSYQHDENGKCIYDKKGKKKTKSRCRVNIKRIEGDIEFTKDDFSSCRPVNVVHSQLQIEHALNRTTSFYTSSYCCNVTVIELPDNYSLILSKKQCYLSPRKIFQIPHLKETLWQIYQKSLHEPILVHCAGGVGRTGHLIFTLELLKNMQTIFSDRDETKIAGRILAELERIRKNRPALVNTKSQFIMAIHNAIALYKYGLEKKYEQKQQEKVTPISLFSSLSKLISPSEQNVHDEPQQKKPW